MCRENMQKQEKTYSDWSCILLNFISIILKQVAFGLSSKAKSLPPSFLKFMQVSTHLNSDSLHMGATILDVQVLV